MMGTVRNAGALEDNYGPIERVRKAETRSSDESYDEGIARRLWEVSAELTNLPA
jgi:muconolactone delta-isomerase